MTTPGPLQSALRLGIVTAAVVLAVAATFLATRDDIAAAEARAERERLLEVLPGDSWDNAVERDWITLAPDARLGPGDGHRAYRARRGGRLAALALQVTAPNGYNGAIRLLVGIREDGALTGVRVVDHRETPGLGDDIELAVSDWILSFDDRSLSDPAANAWAVAPDGGAFDAFTGATITPRAVVAAVHGALAWQAEADWARLAAAPAARTVD